MSSTSVHPSPLSSCSKQRLTVVAFAQDGPNKTEAYHLALNSFALGVSSDASSSPPMTMHVAIHPLQNEDPSMRSRKPTKGSPRDKSSSPHRQPSPDQPKPEPSPDHARKQPQPPVTPPSTATPASVTSSSLVLTLITVGLLYDFSHGVETSWVGQYYDLLNACVGLRARVVPADGWRKTTGPGPGADEPYWWLCPRKSDLERCGLVLSFFVLKFASGVVLSYLYFGVAKYPTRLDLVMFGLFCMATQSSYALYNAVTKDPRFAGLVRLGVSSFKSSKHIQNVVKAQAMGLHTFDVLGYAVLNSEVNSVLRQMDVFYAYYPVRQATLKSLSLMKRIVFSSDMACDFVASIMVTVAVASNRKDVMYLAWAIMFYRFGRNALWTLLSAVVDRLKEVVKHSSQAVSNMAPSPAKPVKSAERKKPHKNKEKVT